MSVDRQGPRLMARLAWILAALLAAPLLSIFYQPIGWGPRLCAAALVLVAAWNPFNGLLVFAGLSPFAATILALTRTGSAPLNYGEALLLAFFVGAAVHRAMKPTPMAVPARFVAATAVLASLAVAALITSAVTLHLERPEIRTDHLLHASLVQNYLVGSNQLTASLFFLGSLALMLMTADACGGNRDRIIAVMRMLMVSGAAAALLNIVRIANSALTQPHAGTAFLIQLATVRTNMHFPDLNAAGSYFVLMLFIALGLMRSLPTYAGLASLFIATGMWIAGSRTAMAAALGVAAAGLFFRPGTGRRSVLLSCALLVSLALVAVLLWKWYPHGRNLESTGAVSYRINTGRAAIALITSHPASGVGPGNFPTMSGLTDNAHNNYLQIAAELGLPALGLFLFVAFSAVRSAWIAAREWPPAWGLCLGLVAYLVTCLAGHPLLVGGAAYPFWIALGLGASLGSLAPSATTMKRLAIAAVVIVAATLPLRTLAAARDADVEHASTGFSKWQRQPDGSRYRWAGGRATFYVSPAARSIRIPLRSGPLAPGPIEVRIYLDGVEANRVILRTEDGEQTVRLNLFRRSKTRFARVDLESRALNDSRILETGPSDTAGVLSVGRPIPES